MAYELKDSDRAFADNIIEFNKYISNRLIVLTCLIAVAIYFFLQFIGNINEQESVIAIFITLVPVVLIVLDMLKACIKRKVIAAIPLVIAAIGASSIAGVSLGVFVQITKIHAIARYDAPKFPGAMQYNVDANWISIKESIGYEVSQRVRTEDADNARLYYHDRLKKHGWKFLDETIGDNDFAKKGRDIDIRINYWHWKDRSKNHCIDRICHGDPDYRKVIVRSHWYHWKDKYLE